MTRRPTRRPAPGRPGFRDVGVTIPRVIKSAIVEERDVRLAELVPHPKNWRTHPKAQQEALRQVLERLGWIQRVIVNRTTGRLLDGHLRVELAAGLGEQTVPVQFVEIPEAEEPLVLATLDPLAGMAGMDAPLLTDILKGIDSDGELQALLADLAGQASRRQVLDAEPLWVKEQKRMQVKWGTEPGQVWKVEGGRHEILIADAGDPDVRAKVRARWDPDAIATDPEYDDAAENVAAVMGGLADRAVVLLPAGRLTYDMCSAPGGWEVRADYVWRHRVPRSMPARGRAVTYHSWILVMAKPKVRLGWRRPWPGFGSVIEVEHEYEETIFGHAKGADLFVAMMAGFQWQRWVDPYLGAGTSILAGEHLAKRVLGIEKSPGVAGLCLERLSAAGLKVKGPAAARR